MSGYYFLAVLHCSLLSLRILRKHRSWRLSRCSFSLMCRAAHFSLVLVAEVSTEHCPNTELLLMIPGFATTKRAMVLVIQQSFFGECVWHCLFSVTDQPVVLAKQVPCSVGWMMISLSNVCSLCSGVSRRSIGTFGQQELPQCSWQQELDCHWEGNTPCLLLKAD